MVRFESTDSLMLARQLPNKTVALILAGGRGSRLKDFDRHPRQTRSPFWWQIPHH